MIPPESACVVEVDLTIDESAVELSILRLRSPNAAVQAALTQAFDAPWPSAPNSVAGDEFRVAWLGPGQWALFGPPGEIADRVEAACRGRLHHLADVSSGYRLWILTGAAAPRLINSGCSLDLHPRVFGEGRCARSVLAQIPILLIRRPDGLDLLAESSLAHYLRSWLARARVAKL
jgi:sarcosine oxidase subunit gamma